MRSKKYSVILIAIMLVAMLTIGLVACKPKPEPALPEPIWQDYLKEVGKAFDSTYNVNFGKAFNFDASLALKYADANEGAAQSFDKTLNLSANINLNDTGTAGSNILALEYGNKGETDADKRLNIYADNENIYLNMFGVKFKLENAAVFTAVKQLIGTVYDVNTEIKGFEEILYAVGFMAFEGGSVNADKTVYSFDFSLKKIADLIMSLVGDQLDEQTKEAIFGIVGATTIEEFMENIPAIKGKIDFNLKDGKFVGVGVSNVDFSFESAKMQGTFDASLQVKNLSNTIDTNLATRIPASDDVTYTTAKIGAVRGSGSLQFMTANKAFITYDWTLESNMDVIAILTGSLLGEDNYFHFRVSHTCDANCGAYCASKYNKGKDKDGNQLLGSNGAIIDIGFSPKDFGTQYIYAAVSLQALIGPAGIDTLAAGMGSALPFVVAEHTLFTIDTSSFAYTNAPFTAEPVTPQADTGIDLGAIMNIIKPILSVIKGINAEELSLTLDLGEILGALGQGAIMDTVNQLITVPGQPLEQIKLDIDMIRFNDTANMGNKDIKYETLYSRGANNPGVKSFDTAASTRNTIALSWAPTVDANGNAYIYTSSGTGTDKDIANAALVKEMEAKLQKDLVDMREKFEAMQMPEDQILEKLNEHRGKEQSKIDAVKKQLEKADSVLTPGEARALIGNGYIQYKVSAIQDPTGADAKTHVKAKITGISGIDYTKFDVPQKVRIMTAVPGAYLDDIVKNALGSFVNIDSIIYTTVTTEITLTKELEFKTTISEQRSEFIMGEDFNLGMTYSYSKMVGEQKVDKTGSVWGWSSAVSSNYDGWIDGKNQYTDRVKKVGAQSVEYNVLGRTIKKDFTVKAPDSATKDVDDQKEMMVQYKLDKLSDGVFNPGFATFTTGEKANKLYLGLDNYTFPYNAKRAAFPNVLGGWTDYAMYFDVVDANTTMTIDLFGCGKVTRVINVIPQPTQYKATLTGSTPVLNVPSVFTLTISNLNNGSGDGYTGLTVEYDITFTSELGGPSGPAIAGKNYTITDIAAFDLPNPMVGDIVKEFKFTPKTAGQFSITVNVMNGNKKVISPSPYTIKVASIPSTYKAAYKATAGKTTEGAITFTQQTATGNLGDIAFFYDALAYNDPENNDWVDVDYDTVLLEIKNGEGTWVSYKTFFAALPYGNAQDKTVYEIRVILKEGAPYGKYRLKLSTYRKGTAEKVGAQMFIMPNFVEPTV